jgi:hypothetical protein
MICFPSLGVHIADATRSFNVLAASGNSVPCDIPATAKAYSLNFTAIPNGVELDYLTVWPEGLSMPTVSTLNDKSGTIVANAAIVPVGTGGEISVYPSAKGSTNLAIDINGYFAAPGTRGLSLYALAPCRVIDTRSSGGAFTGTKIVPVQSSPCKVTSTAQAYVFNATVIPIADPLEFLTLWPDSESQPTASTLNSVDESEMSNMAIVPNEDGSTDAFAQTHGSTQLLLDISAYFAP